MSSRRCTSCLVEKHKGRLKRERGRDKRRFTQARCIRTTANKLKMEDQQWRWLDIWWGAKQGQWGWLTQWWLVLTQSLWILDPHSSLHPSITHKMKNRVMKRNLIIVLLGSVRHLQWLELWDWRKKLAGWLLSVRVWVLEKYKTLKSLGPT